MFTYNPVHELVELNTINVHNKRHYITPDGEQYPSVTTVLGGETKPAIEAWRKSLGAVKADAETKRCADRGTAVHDLIEQYVRGNPLPKASPENMVLFNKVKPLVNKITEVHGIECCLYSDTLMLAGRCDCIGYYNGVLSIIDYKTSNGIKNESMVQDYFLQCTAYALMYKHMTGIEINNIVVISAIERSMFGTVFQRNINEFKVPLLERINNYHDNHGDRK